MNCVSFGGYICIEFYLQGKLDIEVNKIKFVLQSEKILVLAEKELANRALP